MKKIILPIILAAVLGIGGGIAAVTLNLANTASADITEIVSNDLLKPGKYYLDGDVSTDIWIEVTPDHLSLKGSDLDNWLLIRGRKLHDENNIAVTDEQLVDMLDSWHQLFCANKLYQLSRFGVSEWPYIINVDRDNTITDREELLDSNAGFRFNDKTNTIALAVGDFTLVE